MQCIKATTDLEEKGQRSYLYLLVDDINICSYQPQSNLSFQAKIHLEGHLVEFQGQKTKGSTLIQLHDLKLRLIWHPEFLASHDLDKRGQRSNYYMLVGDVDMDHLYQPWDDLSFLYETQAKM